MRARLSASGHRRHRHARGLLIAIALAGCGRDPLDFSGLPDGAATRDGPSAADAIGTKVTSSTPASSTPASSTPSTAPSTLPPPPPAIMPPPSMPPPASSPATPATCALPPCLAKMIASCPPTGPCTQSPQGRGSVHCYANGVRAVVLGGGRGQPVSARVTRSDGSLCYAYDVTPDIRGMVPTVTFRIADGGVVATATVTEAGLTVTCPNDAPRLVGASCASISGAALGQTSACSPGACM